MFPGGAVSADIGLTREFAQTAEDLGYAYVATADHVVGADPAYHPELAGFPYDHETPTAEPFVLLSFIAGCTRRLGLLTNVVILPQRQTVLAAKQAAELDRLSEGRLVLGVGVGWNTAEYGAMGMPFSRRTTTLERQILLLRSLWTQPSVTVTDGQHELDHVAISPRPSRPVPIVIGGMGPLALSLIGRLADGWTVRQYLSWDVEEFEADMLERRAVIAAAAREAGRDPASIRLILRTGGPRLEDQVAMAKRWEALGATHCSLVTQEESAGDTTGAGPTPRQLLDALQAFRDAFGPLAGD